jgi:DNA-binding response OmpR family regulator
LIGKWRFTVGDRLLRDEDGSTLKLSQTEHAFLRYICTVDSNEITTDEFNEVILNRSRPEYMSRLDNFIYRMRQKLGGTVEVTSLRNGRYVFAPVRRLKPHT